MKKPSTDQQETMADPFQQHDIQNDLNLDPQGDEDGKGTNKDDELTEGEGEFQDEEDDEEEVVEWADKDFQPEAELMSSDDDDDDVSTLTDQLQRRRIDSESTAISSQNQEEEGQQQQTKRESQKKKQAFRLKDLEEEDGDISTSAALHRELKNLSFRNPGQRFGSTAIPVEQREKRNSRRLAEEGRRKEGGGSELLEVDRPQRSMRKRATLMREAKSDKMRKNKLRYNNKGKLVVEGGQDEVDLCDCLDPKCDGCQYKCNKCGGHKCSFACRVNRGQIIEYIDVLGSERVNNPFL